MYHWTTFLPLLLTVLGFGLFAKLAARVRHANLAWSHAMVFGVLTFLLCVLGAMMNGNVFVFLPMPLAMLAALLTQLALGGWYFGPRATTQEGQPVMFRGGATIALLAYLLALCVAVLFAVVSHGKLTPGSHQPPLANRDLPVPANKEECAARHGVWSRGPGPERADVPLHCTLPVPDAGKECSSSSDCSVTPCVAEDWLAKPGSKTAGVCAPYQLGGCMSIVDKGIVQPGICVD